MTGYLLDTNIISELRKPRPDARVAAWVEEQEPADLFVSRVVLAEIRFGLELLPPGSDRRLGLEAWLEELVRPWFSGRILEVDESVLVTWRRMMEAARRANRTFAEPDLLIAATAKTHGLTMVTRNLRDFASTGIALLNPWDPPA